MDHAGLVFFVGSGFTLSIRREEEEVKKIVVLKQKQAACIRKTVTQCIRSIHFHDFAISSLLYFHTSFFMVMV